MIDFVNNSEPDLTAENLNKMQQDIGVVVSQTEPQEEERLKVWVKHGEDVEDDILVKDENDTYNSVLLDITNSINSKLECKTIKIQGNNGFNFEIFNPEGKTEIDKMTILIAGADNENNTPILIALRHDKSTTSTTANYVNITGNKTITRKGNKYHINSDQYSRYSIYYPSYFDTNLTEGNL